MPHVKIELFPGRTPEQKLTLAKAITAAFGDALGTRPEAVTIVFAEVAPSDWIAAGEPLGAPVAPKT